jgi:murein DD-endopeptidase MepM/ murein hydrolase activator NlpD
LPYVLGQASRVRQGAAAVAGNHLVLRLLDRDAYVALVHLREGSLRVVRGEAVTTGQPLAACGNSGNSTQPHVHLQAMDSPDLDRARGLPISFRRFREWPRGAREPRLRELGVPAEGSVVEPWPEPGDSGP